jgi:hypothetical protein
MTALATGSFHLHLQTQAATLVAIILAAVYTTFPITSSESGNKSLLKRSKKHIATMPLSNAQ